MITWEYDKIDLNNVPRKAEDIDLLDDAGKDGWELVHISSNGIAYLKRCVVAQAPPKATPERVAKRARTPAPAG